MNYLPIIGICLALVFVMAGGGHRGARASQSIVVIVAAFLVLASIFGYVLTRGS